MAYLISRYGDTRMTRRFASSSYERYVTMDSTSKLAKGTRSPVNDIPHVRSTDENYLNEQYEFGEKLGEGSFGVVWVVKHRETGECFACKIINKEKAGGPRIKLITREVGILKKVNHDHIIKLKEVFETRQKIYLVMELCKGGELSKVLSRKGSLSDAEAQIIMRQLTSAISYLHKNDTVHRDLKLENILLSDIDAELYIKVTDFGLSILKCGYGMDKMMDDFCGTPMYMAPEITDCRTYSEKCDIWAMGVIMLKLVSGLKNDRIIDIIKGQDIKSELGTRHWDKISEAAKDCLTGMLQRNPAHRLTADEVLNCDWIQGRQLDRSARTSNVLILMREFHNEHNAEDDDRHESVEPSTAPVDPDPSIGTVKVNHGPRTGNNKCSKITARAGTAYSNQRISSVRPMKPELEPVVRPATTITQCGRVRSRMSASAVTNFASPMGVRSHQQKST